LVFALKKLKLGEPLKNGISDFRPTGFVVVLDDRNDRIEGFKICLPAFLSVDRRIKVVANGLQGRVASASEYRRKRDQRDRSVGRRPRPRLTF
jgi:hypothetical protein